MIRCASAIAVVLALATGCSAPLLQLPPPPPVDYASLDQPATVAVNTFRATEHERDIAQRYAKALDSTSMRQLASLLDPEAHFAFGQTGARGRERVVGAHDDLFGAFAPRSLTLRRCLVNESMQAVEWTMAGVQARDWRGLTATNHAIDIDGVALLWTADDGTISDVHIYFDEASAKKSLEANTELGGMRGVDAGAPEIVESSGQPQEAANVSLVRRTLDALENNEEAAYVSAFAESVEVYSSWRRGDPIRGTSGVRAYFRAMRGSVAHLDTVIRTAWGAKDYAVIEYFISGLQVGPIDGLPFKPNRVLHLGIVEVAKIRDGQIAGVWRYDSPAQ